MPQGLGTIIMVAVLIAAMYFLMIRPQKKAQQKQKELMDSLAEGSRVMMTSGIYGTIRHLGERQAIVEISPGVDLTVLRRAVVKVATPEEEDFEYADVDDASGPISPVSDWPLRDDASASPASPASPGSPASPNSAASPVSPWSLRNADGLAADLDQDEAASAPEASSNDTAAPEKAEN